jgi:hypothetical protein
VTENKDYEVLAQAMSETVFNTPLANEMFKKSFLKKQRQEIYKSMCDIFGRIEGGQNVEPKLKKKAKSLLKETFEISPQPYHITNIYDKYMSKL